MQALNIAVMLLLIVGGLNWGLVGLADFNLVTAIFGGTHGDPSTLSRIVYAVVGLAALYGFALLAPLSGTSMDSIRARGS
jgi:uncharacterized membrane protein YuzA (DUF378 family)